MDAVMRGMASKLIQEVGEEDTGSAKKLVETVNKMALEYADYATLLGSPESPKPLKGLFKATPFSGLWSYVRL